VPRDTFIAGAEIDALCRRGGATLSHEEPRRFAAT
jgi:hypothetical protein